MEPIEEEFIIELYEEEEMAFEEYDGDALEFESNYVKRRADMTAKKREM